MLGPQSRFQRLAPYQESCRHPVRPASEYCKSLPQHRLATASAPLSWSFVRSTVRRAGHPGTCPSHREAHRPIDRTRRSYSRTHPNPSHRGRPRPQVDPRLRAQHPCGRPAPARRTRRPPLVDRSVGRPDRLRDPRREAMQQRSQPRLDQGSAQRA